MQRCGWLTNWLRRAGQCAVLCVKSWSSRGISYPRGHPQVLLKRSTQRTAIESRRATNLCSMRCVHTDAVAIGVQAQIFDVPNLHTHAWH